MTGLGVVFLQFSLLGFLGFSRSGPAHIWSEAPFTPSQDWGHRLLPATLPVRDLRFVAFFEGGKVLEGQRLCWCLSFR